MFTYYKAYKNYKKDGVKLTFTSNEDTAVNVYFTKESYDKDALLSCNQLFMGCLNLSSLDLSNFDTSKVTDMSMMFYNYYDSKLTTLDVTNWDLNTSNVISMSSMFYGCSGLTTLDLSKWDTSKVTYMSYMFQNCSKLTTIGPVDTASGWQHKPKDHTLMFQDCPATPKPSWY